MPPLDADVFPRALETSAQTEEAHGRSPALAQQWKDLTKRNTIGINSEFRFSNREAGERLSVRLFVFNLPIFSGTFPPLDHLTNAKQLI